MASKLVGLIREISFGRSRGSRKLALYALVDDGKANGSLELSTDDIMEAAEVKERQAKTIKQEFVDTGILTVTHKGGSGRGDVGRYMVNLDLIERLANGEVRYDDLLAKRNLARTPKRTDEAEKHGVIAPFLAADMGAVKGATQSAAKDANKGANKGATALASPTPPSLPVTTVGDNNSPPLTPPAQASKGGREGEILDTILEGVGPEHVVPPLRRMLTLVPIQHASQKMLVDEIAALLAPEHENLVGKAADWVIRNRKKIVSIKCINDAVLEARKATPTVTIRPGDPSFAAWMAHNSGKPAVQSYARSHGFTVHGTWPPGYATKRQEAAE